MSGISLSTLKWSYSFTVVDMSVLHLINIVNCPECGIPIPSYSNKAAYSSKELIMFCKRCDKEFRYSDELRYKMTLLGQLIE